MNRPDGEPNRLIFFDTQQTQQHATMASCMVLFRFDLILYTNSSSIGHLEERGLGREAQLLEDPSPAFPTGRFPAGRVTTRTPSCSLPPS